MWHSESSVHSSLLGATAPKGLSGGGEVVVEETEGLGAQPRKKLKSTGIETSILKPLHRSRNVQ